MTTIKWVASGFPAADGHTFMVSTDGIKFTSIPKSNITNITWSNTNAIASGQGIWIAVGLGLRSNGKYCPIITSTNGINWSPATSINYNSGSFKLEGSGIDFNGTYWVASINMYDQFSGVAALLFKSTDGLNWNLINSKVGFSSHIGFNNVRWLNDRWFVVGNGSLYGTNGYIFTTTNTDATNWSTIHWPYSNITPVKVTSFKNALDVYIAVINSSGQIYISGPNLTNHWSSYNSGLVTSRGLELITYNMILIGKYSPIRLFNSPLARFSTPNRASIIGNDITALSRFIEEGTSGRLIVGNNLGQLAYSTDGGSNWSSLNIPDNVRIGYVKAIGYKA